MNCHLKVAFIVAQLTRTVYEKKNFFFRSLLEKLNFDINGKCAVETSVVIFPRNLFVL